MYATWGLSSIADDPTGGRRLKGVSIYLLLTSPKLFKFSNDIPTSTASPCVSAFFLNNCKIPRTVTLNTFINNVFYAH